ncbi:MAG: hypothetical protein KatS3mg115_1847 [Candidatus Poribacteria bacterium]|nr:MAG: hypothetical protein KatS3mg115_1847 [Candidatus Poribacteria bacterium]
MLTMGLFQKRRWSLFVSLLVVWLLALTIVAAGHAVGHHASGLSCALCLFYHLVSVSLVVPFGIWLLTPSAGLFVGPVLGASRPLSFLLRRPVERAPPAVVIPSLFF